MGDWEINNSKDSVELIANLPYVPWKYVSYVGSIVKEALEQKKKFILNLRKVTGSVNWEVPAEIVRVYMIKYKPQDIRSINDKPEVYLSSEGQKVKGSFDNFDPLFKITLSE